MNKIHKKRAGYTLLEVLTIIGILSVITASAVPSLLNIQRDAVERDRKIAFHEAYSVAENALLSYKLNGNEPPVPATTKVYSVGELGEYATLAKNKFIDGNILKHTGTADYITFSSEENLTVSSIDSDDDPKTWNFYFQVSPQGKFVNVIVVNEGFYTINGGELQEL